MPKVIDHAARRQEIVEALWRLAGRDGIHHVSVRSVADEAGTSPGALRHYFTSQDDLLGFAMESMVERVRDRILSVAARVSGRRGAQLVLEELLPMDPTSRIEIEVYLAFVMRAAVEPSLRAIRDDAEAATRSVVADVLQLLREAGELGAGRQIRTETDQLYPVIDGLALHGVMWPDRYPPAHLRRVLTRALDRLTLPPG